MRFLTGLVSLALALSVCVALATGGYCQALSWSRVDPGSGFGDPNNTTATSMAVYNGVLYTGTANLSGAEVWKYDGWNWSRANQDGFDGTASNVGTYGMAAYNGRLYAGTWNGFTGAEVWVYESGTTWTRVGSSAVWDASNVVAHSMVVYNGRLYVGTHNTNTGTEVWQYDGTNWFQVNVDGFEGTSNNWDTNSMAAFNGFLYAGAHNDNGTQIWRYNGSGFIRVDPGSGFGSPGNVASYCMAAYNGYLYVGTGNWGGVGTEVWRYDGTNWTRSARGGFGDPSNADSLSMAVYNGRLYVGTHNAATGAVVWQYDGTNWVEVSSGGFGDTGNVNAYSMAAYNGYIFAGTNNGSGTQVYRTAAPAIPKITSISPASGSPGTTVTIAGYCFGSSRGAGPAGGAVSYVSFNGVPAAEYPAWTDEEIRAVVPNGATSGPVAVVTSAGASSDTNLFTLCYPTWYLAEGTTAWGFTTYINIVNPDTSSVDVDLTYMTEGGAVPGGTFNLPAESRLTIDPSDKMPNQDFSTKVECKESGKNIAVDRTMSWTGPGAESPEAHNSVGVTAPEKIWYLPEGSSNWGFECFLLIQNPNDREATCTVTYMTETEGPKVVEHKVPPNSRRTYNMEADIGNKDSSIKVESDVPVIPERAMYRNNRREGHDSIGTIMASTDYYLAEGTTAWGFTTFVLIQNPNPTPTDVTIIYMTAEGAQEQPVFQMPANSRKTIRVNAALPEKDFSTKVQGGQPIIAERAMYWDYGLGEACHDSIGITASHTTFFLPDGCTAFGWETWTLVGNPNTADVKVEIAYLSVGGASNKKFEETIPAGTRRTFNMADGLNNSIAGVVVTSKTQGLKVIVERAMYLNNRGAGTDSIGGYAD
ncbi:MAG: IPT/TIG domain-containing protein [Actinobacteria bacterium]|nr:IPT/TIG domain-containing protein [Actinomycetota bacterium]